MSIFFLDSLAHYTTVAQGNQKIASLEQAPIAGLGAFGSPGIQFWYIVNYAGTPTLEISCYCKKAGAGSLFDINHTFISQLGFGVAADGTVYCNRYDYAGFSGVPVRIATSAAAEWQFAAEHHLLCRVVIADAPAGEIFFKIDGRIIFNLAGLDTRSSGGSFGVPAAETTQFRLYSGSIWSHIALANAAGNIVGQPRVQARFATADVQTDFTPVGAGADHKDRINEVTPDDTSYNKSATVGHKDSYEFANALPSTTRILAVQFVPRVSKEDAAVHEVRSFYTEAGIDYPLSTKQVPASVAYLPDCRPINPATGLEYTVAEVNAPLIAGLEIVT